MALNKREQERIRKRKTELLLREPDPVAYENAKEEARLAEELRKRDKARLAEEAKTFPVRKLPYMGPK